MIFDIDRDWIEKISDQKKSLKKNPIEREKYKKISMTTFGSSIL